MSISTDKIQQSANWLRSKTVGRKAKQKLDKGDFMNLFLTQMSHQDPINPMDSGSMMAQLSQLGNMEQLQKLNKGMNELNTTNKKLQQLQSINLLNHDIAVAKPQLQLDNGTATPLHYTLPDEAREVRIVVRRDDGSLIRQEKFPNMSAGRQQYAWDGKDSNGVRLEDGKYNVSLQMMRNDGIVKEIKPYANIRLNQVNYEKGKTVFQANNNRYSLDEISGISNHSEETFSNKIALPIEKNMRAKAIISKLPQEYDNKTK